MFPDQTTFDKEDLEWDNGSENGESDRNKNNPEMTVNETQLLNAFISLVNGPQLKKFVEEKFAVDGNNPPNAHVQEQLYENLANMLRNKDDVSMKDLFKQSYHDADYNR